MLSLFGTQSCGERVAFLADCNLLGVVGNEVILCQNLVYPVPPESKWSLWAFDSVGKTEEVVEDSCYLVDSGCGDTRPQVGLGG